MSDRDSFASFVAARRGALLRTAYLLTGSREDAEDLVQTTLLKAVPRWGRICDHPEPYVRKILVREAVTRHRRRRWGEIAVAEIPETGATEEDVSDREALRRALLTLAPRQRAVVVLRYYHDLTEREVAEAMGISVGTVKSQTRDALTRLRLPGVVIVG